MLRLKITEGETLPPPDEWAWNPQCISFRVERCGPVGYRSKCYERPKAADPTPWIWRPTKRWAKSALQRRIRVMSTASLLRFVPRRPSEGERMIRRATKNSLRGNR